MFVPGKHFQPNRMFASEERAYLNKAPYSNLALLTNTKLDCKSLTGTNTLAYYEHSEIKDVKSFIAFDSGETKSFFLHFYQF